MTPTPLDVLIVDDEPLARLRLRQLLASPDGPAVRVVGEAADGEGLLACLAETPCDLVLLDIALPGRDGLKLAEALGRLPRPPAVVFVTAHGEHALRAFELAAVDYLTKPVRRDRLAMALARVAQQRQAAAAAEAAAAIAATANAATTTATTTATTGSADAPPALPGDGRHVATAAPAGPVSRPHAGPSAVLVVSDRGRVLRVPAAEVLYLKAELKYVTLVSRHGRWLLDEPLAELERRLGAGFLRVHRNAVVALDAVRALARRSGADGDEGWQLQLANGDWLAVSRRQVAEVRHVLAGAPGAPGEPDAPGAAPVRLG